MNGLFAMESVLLLLLLISCARGFYLPGMAASNFCPSKTLELDESAKCQVSACLRDAHGLLCHVLVCVLSTVSGVRTREQPVFNGDSGALRVF